MYLHEVKDKRQEFVSVVVVGGGQAGLSASYYLSKSGIDHVVLERSERFHAWKKDRWDSFCLVTPNWQCRLPGWEYGGKDPNGFMPRDEIVDYLEGFAKSFNPPIREGITVQRVEARADGKIEIESSDRLWISSSVILATGSYDRQIKPDFASKLDPRITQISSKAYKRPSDVPKGICLVVGTGQSGVQMMEDLWLADREVSLSVGAAPRSPRIYRGRDATDWLYEIGEYAVPIDKQPNPEATEAKTNHYLSGRDGGHEIDLREYASNGLQLYGTVRDIEGSDIYFSPNLEENLDRADESYLRICSMIDNYIADLKLNVPEKPTFEKLWRPPKEITHVNAFDSGITSILWCTGFVADYSWLNIDCLDSRGRPRHNRGISEAQGVYFLGLNWLHTWGSGRFLSVAEDAEHVVENIKMKLKDSSTNSLPISV